MYVYTTFCKQDILIAFLSGTDVCAQATPLITFLERDKFLKQDGSQSHTPPTEYTHCKISSLALRHLTTNSKLYKVYKYN